MTVQRIVGLNAASLAFASHPVFYLCTTTAELPTSGLKLGDTALTVDTNIQYKAASATTWTAVTASVSGGSSLTIAPSAPADTFVLTGRTTPGFAVPYLTPTTNNQVVAFDIFPKGVPAADQGATTGVAWIDIVSSDITLDGVNYESLRLGKLKTGIVHVGAAKGGTGTVRDMVLQMNGGVVGIGATDTYLQRTAAGALKTNGTMTATQFITTGGDPFSKTAAFYDATAIAPTTLAVWTAPFACTVTTIKGYRTGGSGATVQAYRGTTATALRSSALSLTSTDTWMDGITGIQNTAFTSGQSLLMGVLTVSGSVTQVSIQVNFTRP